VVGGTPTPAPTGPGAFARNGFHRHRLAMVFGRTWMRVPESSRLIYRGLRSWVGGKDLILHTITQIGVEGPTTRPWSSAARPSRPWRWMTVLPWQHGHRSGGQGRLFTWTKRLGLTCRIDSKALLRSFRRPRRPVRQNGGIRRIIPGAASRLPHSPGNSRESAKRAGFSSISSDRKLYQRMAGRPEGGGRILKGRQVHPRVRCIVIPARRRFTFKP